MYVNKYARKVLPPERQYYLSGGSTAAIMPKSCLLTLPQSCPNTAFTPQYAFLKV
jgi:hypothetical protein